MKKIHLLTALLLASCASAPKVPEGVLTPAQLNASRSQYNGQKVKVQGWMRSEFENYGLWESRKANQRQTFVKDCVSLMIPESMSTGRFNRRYVQVEGIFLERLPQNVVQLGGCNITKLQLIEGTSPIEL